MTGRMNRRSALSLIGAAAVGGAAGVSLGGMASRAFATNAAELLIQHAAFPIAGPITEGLVSTRSDGPPPVLRLRQGEPFAAGVVNGLADYTTMHWHGLRVPNAMDGVPYLTQFPIAEGERFDYRFTSEDAGTFWYHPHCMTMDQMALGLTGVLIVEERDDPGFDADIALNLRDFRLDDAGQWLDLWTPRGAARGGTLGTVMTANWLRAPVYQAPAGGLVRLRLVATDTTRVYRILVPGVSGSMMARDGHPLREPEAFPSLDAPLVLGPGQRADLAIRMPAEAGQVIDVQALARGGTPVLASLEATGPALNRSLNELAPLPPNPIPEPDLDHARIEEFVFGWSPDGDLPDNGFCGTLGYTFWSVNRQPWPGDAVADAGPLATFRRGESVVLRLRNESPNAHPIHLHGLVFRPIASNKRPVPSNWTDTALLLRNETMDVALVADNPGDWAFHCHVIEHQKTGLAGFIRVTET